MCGIFGMSYGEQGAAGELWTPTELSTLMFPAIVHRGPHAFGWMSYNPSTGITIQKFPGKVTDHMSRVCLDDECAWFVGHVRYATNGSPDLNVNNHPLTHGKVVGVHNGVLRDWKRIISTTGREDDTAEVDSEAIFAAVNKWGDTNGLRRIEGDMVAVYARTNHPGILNIARTYGRPLVYATTEAGSLVFASECCVIDACGMTTSDPEDFTGRYRRLKVKKGAIVERAQFRTDPGPSKSRRVTTTRGVRGITDYFDDLRGSSLLSTDPPSGQAAERREAAHTSGTAKGYVDVNGGGVYVGAGWWRLPAGKYLSASEYVDYVAKRVREVDACSRQIDTGLSQEAAAAAAADESAAHDIEAGAVVAVQEATA